VNDDDLAYAKIRMDESSFATAIAHLADIEDPLARALVWGSAWDSTRDAEVAPSAYVDLVLGNIATETESTTLRLSLTQLIQVARTYVAPEKRDATITRIGDALWQLAQNAEAGSDAQFQFVKFFANVASTPEHGDALAGLRDGSVDSSGPGNRHRPVVGAARGPRAHRPCRARPRSWQHLPQTTRRTVNRRGTRPAPRSRLPKGNSRRSLRPSATRTISNVVLRSMGNRFPAWSTTPTRWPRPFAPYFDALASVWKSRSYQMASYVLQFFYPGPLASQALVDATQAWLDANPDIPALRRLVVENLAGVTRALEAQKRDASSPRELRGL